MTDVSPLDDLFRRPGFLFKRCHQVTTAIFAEECREFNITTSQFGALRALQEIPGIDQIALGRLTGLDRSTVGLVIKLLVQRKLIERVVNPRDKRRMNLRLSPSGAKLLTKLRPSTARAQERALSVLPEETRKQMIEIMMRFLEGHNALIDMDAIVSETPPSP